MNRRVVAILALWLCVIFPWAQLVHAKGRNWGDGIVQIWIAVKGNDGKLWPASGTGFVLNAQGYIATNNHVVDSVYNTRAGVDAIYVNPDGASFSQNDVVDRPNAKIIWTSKDLDLAILKLVDEVNFKPVVLSRQLPEVGDGVVAVGYPGVAEQNKETSLGDVTSRYTLTNGVFSKESPGTWGGKSFQLLQHSADVSWGNSGGPLFDSCKRVIGVNTRIALKEINQQIVFTPGVSFASGIGELIRELDSRQIPYFSDESVCLSEEEHMNDLLKKIVIVGAVAILILGVLVIVALRRPRERIVRVLEGVSRSVRHMDPAPVPPTPHVPQPAPNLSQQGLSVLLVGQDSSGFRYQVVISEPDLARGIAIGREPPDPRMTINHPDISRQHAWIGLRDGYVVLKDNGSTNGTKVNGRALRPRQEQVIANGDVIELGTVSFRVEIR